MQAGGITDPLAPLAFVMPGVSANANTSTPRTKHKTGNISILAAQNSDENLSLIGAESINLTR